MWLFLLLLGIQNIYNSSYLFSAFDREAKSAVEKVKESLALDQELKLIVCSYDSDSVKYYFREAVEVLEKWPERFFCQKELLATVLESTEKRVLLWMFPFKGNEQAWLRGSTHRVEQRFEYSDSKLFILRKNRE